MFHCVFLPSPFNQTRPWKENDRTSPAVWYPGQMKPEVGSLLQYLYFVFAPTLLYRDEYPRYFKLGFSSKSVRSFYVVQEKACYCSHAANVYGIDKYPLFQVHSKLVGKVRFHSHDTHLFVVQWLILSLKILGMLKF